MRWTRNHDPHGLGHRPAHLRQNASTNAISYVAARGHQHVTHLESQPPDTLSATTNHGPAEPVGLAIRLSPNNAEPLEVNAVN
jgi:hypothetical protein